MDKPGMYELEDSQFVNDFLDRARLLATTKVIRRISSGTASLPVKSQSPDTGGQGDSDIRWSVSKSSDTFRSDVSSVSFGEPGGTLSVGTTDSPPFTSFANDNNGAGTMDHYLKSEHSGSAEHVIAIAASTGGPQALCAVLGMLPPSIKAGIVVVQHLSLGFEEGFALWLATQTELSVIIGEDGTLIKDGRVILAPPGHHVIVAEDGTVRFHEAPPVAGHIPSASFLFSSVAKVYGPQSTGVILTGMGSDGAREIGLIKSAGGLTIAQDEATSVIFGMPGVAVELGSVNEVLPVQDIGLRLKHWVGC
jgi:chemotaxis response regulator CheB